MKIKILYIFFLSVVGLSFTNHFVLKLSFPSFFPEPVYNFDENALSQPKIDLGRMLFYDPILSIDQSVSCADCHSPYNAFAHTDHQLSHGIHDSIGTRNAPPLFNLAWQPFYMWDGAIQNLDMQVLAPLSHPAEMGENISHVIQKLNQEQKYKEAFFKAWGDSVITGTHFLKSIAQFELTLVSSTSKYDAYVLGEETFTEQEEQGYSLFKKHCNSCHTEPLFSSYGFADNGLLMDSTLQDIGRFKLSTNSEDRFKFKIPSLRNLTYTYPYMHDGRFDKLYQVLNHYSNLQPGDSPEKELQKAIPLQPKDKTDLIAFLLTLNDSKFVFDPKNKYPRKLLLNNK